MRQSILDMLCGFLMGIILISLMFGIISIKNPKLMLTEKQRQYIENAEQMEENIETFKEYKNICDVIYDTEIDPTGDTFTETDMGAYYLKLRMKTDSIIKKTYCIGEI